MAITPEQCRAARGLLNWSQPKLAAAAGTARSTITDFERGAHKLHESNQIAIHTTLETAGVIFIDRDGEAGPGVRLRD